MTEIGLGVIGVGNWGLLHARTYASTPGARLVAVCDSNGDRARQAGALGEEVAVYTEFQALLRDPRVHAVSIALPDFLHQEAALAAAQAGKHILIEKPLATTEAEAKAILKATEAAGVFLMVDFHNRWSPLFQALQQSLESGELGEPQLITYRLNDTLFVPTQMLSWAARSSVAWFLASHCLDTLLWLRRARQGEDTVERLSCITRKRLLATEYGVDTPDFYLTTLEWRSGLVTTLENAWILPECGPSVFDLKCQVIGSRGAFLIDGSHHAAAQKQTQAVHYPDTFVATTLHGQPMGFGVESIRHFARCVMTGQPPLVDGWDGLAVTRLILKMEESARLQQPVLVGPLYGE